MIKLSLIKKGFVTLLLSCLVLMTVNYFLMLRHSQKYSTTSLENRHFTKSDRPNYKKSDYLKSSSDKHPHHLNKVIEKAPNISKCGYGVCLTQWL